MCARTFIGTGVWTSESDLPERGCLKMKEVESCKLRTFFGTCGSEKRLTVNNEFLMLQFFGFPISDWQSVGGSHEHRTRAA